MDADQLAQRCAESMWAQDNASQALGMKIEAVKEGEATLSMRVREDMVNGHRTCHGGMVFSLADSAFAFACNSQNEVAVAASCSIDFLAPAQLGDVLAAQAVKVHQGKRSGLYDVTVTRQDGTLVAKFKGRSSRIGQAVIDPSTAKQSE
ncbi:hydroxyphenylacetyl-CoA thioesterase PaaI [Proteobacteria bacterium 005FR1]|nr:hydroxyphenylacetyl-CoA thioesterase PaaI [Proteobacteria bacterium 005FR1]